MSRLKTVAAFLLLVGALGCKRESPALPESADHYYRALSFQNIPLVAGQRIAQFEVALVGARVRALNRIPDDWSMEVSGPRSGVSKISGIAGHGAGWLDSAEDIGQFATVLVVATNFGIRGTMTLAKGDDETNFVLTRMNFKLERVPSKAVDRE